MKFILVTVTAFILSLFAMRADANVTIIDSDGVSTSTRLTDSTFEKLWTSSALVCIKNGTQFIGSNEAFKKHFGDYKSRKRNCAGPDSKRSKANALAGYPVTKLDPAQLPQKYLCQIIKCK